MKKEIKPINVANPDADMIILRRMRKMKKKEDMEDRSNWALIERTRDIGNVPKGIYRICPCCMYPEKLKKEDMELLMDELKGKIPPESGLILPE